MSPVGFAHSSLTSLRPWPLSLARNQRRHASKKTVDLSWLLSAAVGGKALLRSVKEERGEAPRVT